MSSRRPASTAAARDDAAARLIEQVEALRRTQPEAAWEILARGFPTVARGVPPRRRGELWRLRGHGPPSLRRLPAAAAADRPVLACDPPRGELLEAGATAIGQSEAL